MEVRFDNWFSEKENLHQEEDNKVLEVCKILEETIIYMNKMEHFGLKQSTSVMKEIE